MRGRDLSWAFYMDFDICVARGSSSTRLAHVQHLVFQVICIVWARGSDALSPFAMHHNDIRRISLVSDTCEQFFCVALWLPYDVNYVFASFPF